MATGYSVSPQVSYGLVGARGPGINYAATGGNFSAGDTITIVSSDASDQLSVEGVGSIQNAPNSVTALPTGGATFGVIVQPENQGVKTLVSTNGQSWGDPSPVSYVAYPPIILPLGVTAQTQPLQNTDLWMEANENRPFTFTFVDQNGSPLVLVGHVLEMEIFTDNGVIQIVITKSPAISINENVVTVTIDYSDIDASGTFFYMLWDEAMSIVLATGKLQVNLVPAP